MKKRIKIRQLISVGMSMVMIMLTAIPVAAGEQPDESVIVIEDSELPYGLAGMENDFVLSSEDIEDKEAIRQHNVAGTLAGLTPGIDYADNEIMYSADSMEYAEEVAKAYNAELISFAYGIAVARITDPNVTVAQIVEAGADPSNDLPAVSPNYIIRMEDPSVSDAYVETGVSDSFMGSAGDVWSWSDVVKENNDPALDPDYRFPEYNIDLTGDKPVVVTPEESDYKNGYQWMHDMIGTYEAWGTTRGSNKVTVAVIDSFVDTDHEDLRSNDTRTVSMIPEDDQKQILGGGDILDTSGHGTHVAGIIGMTPDNGKGGVGIAPDVNILGVSVASRLDYEDDDGNKRTRAEIKSESICRAINYVARSDSDQKPLAQVINMSIGGPNYNRDEEKAIQNAIGKNVTVVAAMGNDITNIINYPAGYDGVISVVAVDKDGNRSDFSTYGEWATIAAPGSAIYSTWNGHKTDEDDENIFTTEDHNDWYASWDGTSMASPVVAGVCALYMSEYLENNGKYPTPSEVKDALVKSATKNPDKLMGAGIVNAAALFTDTAKDKHTAQVEIEYKKTAEDPAYKDLAANTELGEDSVIRFCTVGNVPSFHYLYTVNGSNPAMKDDICKTGTFEAKRPEGSDDYVIGAKELMAAGVGFGDTFTLKAAYVSTKGTMGQVVVVKNLKLSGNKTTAGTKLNIYGSTYVTMGKSVTYTAALDPADASYLKKQGVKWSLVEEVPGVTLSAAGKLTVKKTVQAGTAIKIQAKINGADDIEPAVFEATVKPPVTSVTANARVEEMTEYQKNVYVPIEKKGTLSSIRLYTVDLFNSDDTKENQVYVDVNTNLGAQSRVTFDSSDPAVAYVEYDAKENSFLIKSGRKAGSARVTFTADDGGRKKTTFTVRSIIPMSAVNICNKDKQTILAYGKSMKLNAIPGSTYGKPSITKVTWDYTVQAVFVKNTEKPDSLERDITAKFKDEKLVTISSAGKLTLNKKADFTPDVPGEAGEGYRFSHFKIKVTARTTDGSENVGSYTVFTTSPVKSMACYEEHVSDKDGNKQTLDEIKRFEWNTAEEGDVSKESMNMSNLHIALTGPSYKNEQLISCSSTNPESVAFRFLAIEKDKDGKSFINALMIVRGKGSGKLNIKATDGSGKKLTIPFKVY